jgi:microcystin-dependent protein
VTLLLTQMPAHSHTAACSSDDGNGGSPTGNVPASSGNPIYSNTANGLMNATMIGSAGGSQPHNNVQPYLVLNYCIALEGIYPSRN